LITAPSAVAFGLTGGELDKLIERTDTSQSYDYRPKETQRPYESHGNYEKDYEKYKKHKKSSFLSDLFDFD